MAHILVIDDDPGCRGALGRTLSMEGHQVHLASGGAQALALLFAGLKVDLVLTGASEGRAGADRRRGCVRFDDPMAQRDTRDRGRRV